MSKNAFRNKGHHEAAMEKAKEMIDRGQGMEEIVETTHLTEDDVKKAKNKWVDQS